MFTTTAKTSQRRPQRDRGRGTLLSALFGLIVLGSGFAALAWFVPVTSGSRQETFQGDVDRLVVEAAGDVTVVAGDSTGVTVERQWALNRTRDAEVELSDGVLTVRATCSLLAIRCRADVMATVSEGAEVLVTSDNGSISVTGTTGGVELTTSSGDVQVADVDGVAILSTSTGSVLGRLRSHDVTAYSSSGDVELSVTGDIDRLRAESSSGVVNLLVTDDVYRVDAEASSGEVTVGVATDPTSERLITAYSSSGDVTVSPLGR
ncbi:MAG: DUF4097 family beta strand repeat-containing protein [Acidimicrobiia bacterium]